VIYIVPLEAPQISDPGARKLPTAKFAVL
jgi:hypothetical protein